MRDAIVLLTGAYHLGNNPGVFQDAQYVGLKLDFPAKLTWKPPAGVELIFYTHDIETWGGTGGHAVTINDTEVGRLRDVVNTHHPTEITTITIDKSIFDTAIGGGDEFRLGITVTGGSLADDFVLTRVETRGFAALLGI